MERTLFATPEFGDHIRLLGDQIAELTLPEARRLSDYLKEVYGIKPEASQVAVRQAEREQPDDAIATFTVVVEEVGARIDAIRVVRQRFGLGLAEARDLIDALPYVVQGGCSREEAEELADAFREVGCRVTVT